MPGDFFLRKKEGRGQKKKIKRKKTRKEGNFALLLVDKLARLAQKKKKISSFTTLTGLKFWRNRKQTICAMLVSVHYIEIVQFFSAISFIIS